MAKIITLFNRTNKLTSAMFPNHGGELFVQAQSALRVGIDGLAQTDTRILERIPGTSFEYSLGKADSLRDTISIQASKRREAAEAKMKETPVDEEEEEEDDELDAAADELAAQRLANLNEGAALTLEQVEAHVEGMGEQPPAAPEGEATAPAAPVVESTEPPAAPEGEAAKPADEAASEETAPPAAPEGESTETKPADEAASEEAASAAPEGEAAASVATGDETPPAAPEGEATAPAAPEGEAAKPEEAAAAPAAEVQSGRKRPGK